MCLRIPCQSSQERCVYVVGGRCVALQSGRPVGSYSTVTTNPLAPLLSARFPTSYPLSTFLTPPPPPPLPPRPLHLYPPRHPSISSLRFTISISRAGAIMDTETHSPNSNSYQNQNEVQGQPDSGSLRPPKSAPNSGPFQCNICQRSYGRLDHLARHFRSRGSPFLQPSV